MKLTPYEKFRNERDRAFQSRVLSALEKKKKGPIQEYLNMPIVLWLLSVMVLTLGGVYFTARQRCFSEADRIEESYVKIRTEMLYRWDHISKSVANAESLEQLKRDLKSIPLRYYDYRNSQLWELKDQVGALERRVDFIDQLVVSVARARMEISMSLGLDSLKTPEFERYNGLYMGDTAPDDLTEVDLPILKKFIQFKSILLYKYGHVIDWGGGYFSSNCSTFTVIADIIHGGYDTHFVTSYLPPLISGWEASDLSRPRPKGPRIGN